MAIFIDTGLFLALYNAEDAHHQRSKELFKDALTGSLGRIYTSDYVIDEAITIIMVRTKQHNLAAELGKYLIESPRITKLTVDGDVFTEAWRIFQSLNDKFLSFTDCTSLALLEKHRLNQIMSFDHGFDGLTKRIA
ncbi:type II toxin-antitoxin system VapC family toxin [Candidatus Bathyarchaeota archaeon]|nr:type II toxin-antitoxin system VapC family toxin [Candidatus Bathyarchaeota archaeon]